MAIGMGEIIGIALRIVANREKIRDLWGQIGPLIQEIAGRDRKLKDLIEDILPGRPSLDPQEFTVEWLQESLNTLGADPQLIVDGEYGQATNEAVLQYQEEHPPLVPDGWAGVQTQASIVEELAKLEA